LFVVSLRCLGILNWQSARQSGETSFVINILPQIDQEGNTVLDVGANEGEFIAAVVGNSKHLKVIGIEPHPSTFGRLKRRFQSLSDRVSVLNIGAGNTETMMPLYDYSDRDGTGHASLFKDVIEGIHHGVSTSWEVLIRRLDDVVADCQAEIALIKIDVEGFELDVLRGLENTIRSRKVKAIVIEFNEMNVVSGVFAKNFIDLLNEYRPYRLLPEGRLLPLLPYQALFVELFAYQNLVFIRDDALWLQPNMPKSTR
jgi:FkbM family methyltransferase